MTGWLCGNRIIYISSFDFVNQAHFARERDWWVASGHVVEVTSRVKVEWRIETAILNLFHIRCSVCMWEGVTCRCFCSLLFSRIALRTYFRTVVEPICQQWIRSSKLTVFELYLLFCWQICGPVSCLAVRCQCAEPTVKLNREQLNIGPTVNSLCLKADLTQEITRSDPYCCFLMLLSSMLSHNYGNRKCIEYGQAHRLMLLSDKYKRRVNPSRMSSQTLDLYGF